MIVEAAFHRADFTLDCFHLLHELSTDMLRDSVFQLTAVVNDKLLVWLAVHEQKSKVV